MYLASDKILAMEAENKDKIILMLEGIFWTAYERSAFQICTTMEEFETSKYAVKKLGGVELISIGVQEKTLERLFGDCERLTDEVRMRIYPAKGVVDEEAFEAWKSGKPLKERNSKKKDSSVASLPQNGNETLPGDPIVERIRGFDVAASTPVDCMMLVIELKKMITDGTLYRT